MQPNILYVDHRHTGIRNMQTLPIIENAKKVHVLGSRAAITATGHTALVFQTKEAGTMAFPINLAAIEGLRAALTEIEQYLIHSNPKKAH
jgi:hypothetical protein